MIKLTDNSNSDAYTFSNSKNYLLNIAEFINSWPDTGPNNNKQLWIWINGIIEMGWSSLIRFLAVKQDQV